MVRPGGVVFGASTIPRNSRIRLNLLHFSMAAFFILVVLFLYIGKRSKIKGVRFVFIKKKR